MPVEGPPGAQYAARMSMLRERLQVLVSEEQRRRLEQAARAEGKSVAAVVRDAIDRRLASGTDARARRLRAVDELRGLSRIADVSPEEIERAIVQGADEEAGGSLLS